MIISLITGKGHVFLRADEVAGVTFYEATPGERLKSTVLLKGGGLLYVEETPGVVMARLAAFLPEWQDPWGSVARTGAADPLRVLSDRLNEAVYLLQQVLPAIPGGPAGHLCSDILGLTNGHPPSPGACSACGRQGLHPKNLKGVCRECYRAANPGVIA